MAVLRAPEALLENGEVVPRVAHDDVRQRAHAQVRAVGLAPAHPRGFWQRAKERHVRAPRGFPVRYHVRERQAVAFSVRGEQRFVVARERGGVAAREPQRAVAEHALAVRDVPDHFLEGPRVRRVQHARVRFAHGAEEREHLIELRREHRQRVRFGHEVHIPGEEPGVLGRFGLAHCGAPKGNQRMSDVFAPSNPT
jgi:hypothetical protein